jgi:hypothetical protein
MKIRLFCGIVVLLAVFSAANVHAQDTGAITGTVRDNTGAVIQGADVKISGTAGGIERATTTNSDGDYLEAGLPGGTYNLSISAKGFKTFKGNGVALRVGQRARVDAALAVGDIGTEIVVQGEQLNQVETQTSELSGTVTGRQISQLQLNGRNYTQLLALTPGATNQSGADEPGTGLATVAYSVNGGRTEYNNWEVDGGNNMDDGSNTTLMTYPSIDAIGEVRLLTSNYGAQYGRNGSGTVEIETKSGTRSFHGDVYEFVRNDAFNARNFFLPNVPKYKKNDYGYTIGGPVFIPGFYNESKMKTFFFWSQEWRREILPTNFNVPVPSCAERGLQPGTGGVGCTGTQGTFGDFSEPCNLPPPNGPVDCPQFTPQGSTTPQPFTNNLVPIDPNAVPLLAMFPFPNTHSPDSASWSYNASASQPTHWREELFRIDHNINSNLHATVRYIHDSWNSVNPTPLWTNGASYPTIQDQYGQPATSLVAHLTATITPTLLNEFVASYSVNHITFQNLGAWQRPAGYNLGLFQNGFGGGKLPGISLGGGTLFNGIAQDAGYVPNGPVNSNPSYTYRDNVSKSLGKHNLQFGGYFVASQKNELPQFEPSVNGFITYDVGFSHSANPFADLLTGNISSFGQASGQPKYYLRYKIFEPYFQDDWHVKPRLTLNLGLRISLYGTVYDNKKQAYNFDPTKYVQGATSLNPDGTINTNTNVSNGLVQCGVGGIPTGCAKGHLFNPAPRIGFAWDPWGDGKTAIRGGYGVFFEHTNGNEAVATALEGSPPLVQNPAQQSIATTFDSSGNIVTSGYSLVGGSLGAQFPQSVVSIPQKQVWPYVQQWHFDVQHELPHHIVAVVSYVGSKGTHLGQRYDLNQIRPTPLSSNPYQPGQPFTGVILNPDGTVKYPGDCAQGTAGQGGPNIQGYNPNPDPNVPITSQETGAGVNMYVACGNNPDFFRPFLGYSDIRAQRNTASSIYHGLQLSGRKTVGTLQLSASYTYSHSIDDASSAGDTSFLNSYDLAANRASSNFDQRHVFTLSYIYDLPFFKGSGLTHSLLGGWQWSGITVIQTGTPFSVTNAGDGIAIPGDNAGVANGTGTNSRPDLIGDPNARIPGSGAGLIGGNLFGPLLYNPGAFAAPRGLTFGTAGRNIVRNPRQTNFDMAIFKHFPVREAMSFEFRAEAFNVFNHTEFGYIGGDAGSAGNNSGISSFSNSVGCYAGPNNTPNDPGCLSGGLLRPAAAHNPRILQLALKFIF